MFGNFNEEQSNDRNIQVYDTVKATELMLCYRFPIGVYAGCSGEAFLKNRESDSERNFL